MHKKFLYGVLLVILLGGGLEVAHRILWLTDAEDFYYDVWHQVAGLRFHPQHVAIVAIDDQTLREHQFFWRPAQSL